MVWRNSLFGATSWNAMRMWISNVYEEQLAVTITVGSGYSDMRVWHYWSSLFLAGLFCVTECLLFLLFVKKGGRLIVKTLDPFEIHIFTEDKVTKKCTCTILNAFIKIKKTQLHYIYHTSVTQFILFTKKTKTLIEIYQTTQHIHVFTKYNFVSDSWTEKVSKSLYLSIYSTDNTFTKFLHLLPERDPYRNHTCHDVKWPNVRRSDPESVMSQVRER